MDRFHLDKAVPAWRRTLEHDSALTSDDLDELERHLRDQVAGLVADGLTEKAAFDRALREMGDQATATSEYGKVYWAKRLRRGELLHELAVRMSMLKNYLKVALRTLWRHKGYSLINITGLSIGLAACLLITLYIRHELSFDRLHERGDRIVRLVSEVGDFGLNTHSSATAAARIEESFPQVEAMVRVRNEEVAVSRDEGWQTEDGFMYVDATFLNVFSFEMLEGDPNTALDRPGTVVLTASTAQRYFGGDPAVGRSLSLNDGQAFEVTGIVHDPPDPSHLQFDFLASITSLGELDPYSQWVQVYYLLSEPEAAGRLQAGLDRLTSPHGEGSDVRPARPGDRILDGERDHLEHLSTTFGIAVQGLAFHIQPLFRIHLHSERIGLFVSGGSARYLYVFSVVALFILLIACINYTNLATARYAQRARGVGIRKVVGAGRLQLAGQFVGESLMMCAIAVVPAVVLAGVLLPSFNQTIGRSLAFQFDVTLIGFLLLILVMTGLAAGSYPALFLTRLRPANMLRTGEAAPSGGRLRRGLVVFQFGITVVLIACTLGVHEQLEFMRSKPLGYDSDHIAQLSLPEALRERGSTLKAEVTHLPGVVSASLASGLPGHGGMVTMIEHDGEMTRLHLFSADADYLETMGMSLVASSESDAGTLGVRPTLINETAARMLRSDAGATSALLGTEIPWMGGDRTVAGIIDDYHIASLHEPILPIVGDLNREPAAGNAVVIRLAPQGLAATVQALEEVWRSFAPDEPADITFVDDVLAEHYVTEQRLARLFKGFAVLAILIACLGLFGLAAYTAEQRTKEIGVRKVLGASIASIASLLSRDFLKLVVIAVFPAIPIAYLAIHRWLDDFAYRIDLSWWIFAVAAALSVTIAVAAVSYQAVKAALADPVKSLRYE